MNNSLHNTPSHKDPSHEKRVPFPGVVFPESDLEEYHALVGVTQELSLVHTEGVQKQFHHQINSTVV